MSSCVDKYGAFAKHVQSVSALEGVMGLLGWDEMVMQPSNAAGIKGKQKEVLAGVIHEKRTDDVLGGLLNDLKSDNDDLNAVQKRNVEIALKDYTKAKAIPKALSEEIAALESEGYHKWAEARQASDYAVFKPILEKWVKISLEKAKLISASEDPYNVLLDDFETGMTADRLDEIFGQLREGLVPLIKDIREKGTAPDGAFLKGKSFDVDKQAKMCESIALDLGFSLDTGRLDVSVHPFTGGSHSTDVRMTTRFKENDLTEGLTGAIHETGHSLYEMGRNLEGDWADMPANKAMSMGVHESQSLLWERMVALSRPFQDYLLTKLNAFFPGDFDGISAEQLYGAMNVVKPATESFIRVEADEVTYSMHILLRYELERQLIAGTISVDDVPKAWNAKMEEYLGTKVEKDAQGVLQDVHWSAGAIGYFPTYTLGAMIAVQLFDKAKQDIPDLESQLSQGAFSPLREWLRTNVHKKGSFPRNFDALLTEVTGAPLDPTLYTKFLRNKYEQLYKF